VGYAAGVCWVRCTSLDCGAEGPNRDSEGDAVSAWNHRPSVKADTVRTLLRLHRDGMIVDHHTGEPVMRLANGAQGRELEAVRIVFPGATLLVDVDAERRAVAPVLA
jgi:hypothetical protein